MRKNRLVLCVQGALCCVSFTTFAQSEETLVVTASGFEQQIKNAPASISVITAKQIENKPYRDITDALRDIPGVDISGSGGSTDISIRGMGAKYTLILIDGKRVTSRETRPNSDAGGIEQGWLPPLSAIDRIEVVRGPMSSLYGSDAMGGVINIITKRIGQHWKGQLRAEGTLQEHSSSSDGYNTSFSLSGPLIQERLGLQVYGQYSKRIEDQYINGYPEQRLRNINGKLSFKANNQNHIDLELGSNKQDRLSTAGNSSSSDSEHHSQRTNQSITHYGNWEWASTTTTVSHEKTNNTSRNMKIDNTDVDTQILIPFVNHMLTVGGKYNYQKLADGNNKLNPFVTSIDRWNYALFAEDEWALLNNLSLTAGLRFNQDELYGNNWNPRIYAAWHIDDNFTLKSGISTGYTTPSLRYTVADWGQGTGGGRSNGVIIGNPDLQPEKSTNYEVTLGYTNDLGYQASITTYFTRFKNKIQSQYICGNSSTPACTNGFDFTQTRYNVDNAEVKGIEISAKMPFTQYLSLTSSYSWIESKQKSGEYEGLALNRIPKHKFNAQLDWQATHQLDLWLKFTYYGEEMQTSSKSSQALGTYYPGYTLWDLGGVFHVNKSINLYAGIYNVFDKTVDYDTFGKIQDGRRYWLGASIGF